jgi:hypothetical protein
VSLEEAGHAAVADGEIVGASVLKVVRCSGRRVGIVSWIMVDPDHQGEGIASRLMELAHEWFESHRVDALLALVEGYNQSSSKLFKARGYRLLSLADQIREFRWGLLKAWFSSYFLVAIGHYLWFREADADTTVAPDAAEPERGSSLAGLLNAISLNAILVAIIILRHQVTGEPWVLLTAAIGIPATIILLRAGTMAAVARFRGVRTVFRSWLGGSPIALVIAAAIGGYIPVPGAVYPRAGSYRYRDHLPALGAGSLAAGAVLALLLAGVHLARVLLPVAGHTDLLLDLAASLLLPQVIVDILLPFFPLSGYLGRQVWNWNRRAWLALAVVAGAAVVVVFTV